MSLLEKSVPLPFGASLVCIAKKPDTQCKDSEKNSWVTAIARRHGFYDVLTEQTYDMLIKKTLIAKNIPKGARVLDAGCGTAAFTMRFLVYS